MDCTMRLQRCGGRGNAGETVMVEGYAAKESASAFSGKGGRGKGAWQKIDRPCFNWQATGQCYYGDNCKFNHDQAQTGQGPTTQVDSVRALAENERAELEQYRSMMASARQGKLREKEIEDNNPQKGGSWQWGGYPPTASLPGPPHCQLPRISHYQPPGNSSKYG